jgi:hypothetical protein
MIGALPKTMPFGDGIIGSAAFVLGDVDRSHSRFDAT